MPTPAGTQQGKESSAPPNPERNQHLKDWCWEVSEPHPVMYSWGQLLLASRHRSLETTPSHSSHVGTSQEQSWSGAGQGRRAGASRDPTLVHSTSGRSVRDPAQRSWHLCACTIYELQHETLAGGMSKQN